MKLRKSLRLPKEHGAWAMLYVPFGVGAVAGSSSSSSPAPLFLLLLSVTFAFIARQSLLDWWIARSRGNPDAVARRMMWTYVGLAGLFGAPLIFFYHRTWLAPVAALTGLLLALNTRQAVRQRDRTVIGETIAILGLTVTAPTAYYVCEGAWDKGAWLLWALCVLYFASSVFYVRMRVHSLNRRREELRKQSLRRCVLYHVFMVTALAVLAVTCDTNLFVLVAFVPVLTRTVWRLEKPGGRISLKRIGVLETVYSIFFLVFIAIGFRAL